MKHIIVILCCCIALGCHSEKRVGAKFNECFVKETGAIIPPHQRNNEGYIYFAFDVHQNGVVLQYDVDNVAFVVSLFKYPEAKREELLENMLRLKMIYPYNKKSFRNCYIRKSDIPNAMGTLIGYHENLMYLYSFRQPYEGDVGLAVLVKANECMRIALDD